MCNYFTNETFCFIKPIIMIDFDALSSYKAQRTYSGFIIYLVYADGQGTWSVWDTSDYDTKKEPDPLMVYGSKERGYLVRTDMLASGTYTTKQEGTNAAKDFIEALQLALLEEEELSIAA